MATPNMAPLSRDEFEAFVDRFAHESATESGYGWPEIVGRLIGTVRERDRRWSRSVAWLNEHEGAIAAMAAIIRGAAGVGPTVEPDVLACAILEGGFRTFRTATDWFAVQITERWAD